MKYYLVYLLNYKENDTVTLKDSYQNKDDALKSLERNAVEYIRDLQGKQQAEICKQDKKPKDILKEAIDPITINLPNHLSPHLGLASQSLP
jgi:parvulin-like peptidyl-prolyl isomerase